ERRVILLSDTDAFVEDFPHALGVHGLLGFVGEALAVGGLVVNDRDLLVFEVLGDVFARDRALLVVAAAGAEDVPHVAFGDLGIGRGRRDRQHVVLLVDFRRRDGHARGDVTDDEFCAVAGKLVGDRDALLGIAHVVADARGELLAQNAAGLVDVGDGLLGTLLEL